MADGLRAAGLKLTPQRLAIVEALADDTSHPTAQELFERLRRRLPTMSFATVYSTLDTLAHEGLCSVRVLAPGATRFDPKTDPHDHALCDQCGAMVDVEERPRERPRVHGFVVREVETIYRGLCAACAGPKKQDKQDKKDKKEIKRP